MLKLLADYIELRFVVATSRFLPFDEAVALSYVHQMDWAIQIVAA
jgi:hypothetical protein